MAGVPTGPSKELPPVGYVRCPNCGLTQERTRIGRDGLVQCQNGLCRILFNVSDAMGYFSRDGKPTSKMLAKLYPATPTDDYPRIQAPEPLAEVPIEESPAESLAASALAGLSSAAAAAVAIPVEPAESPQRKRRLSFPKPAPKRVLPGVVTKQSLKRRAEQAEARALAAQQLAAQLTQANYRLDQENKIHAQSLAALASRHMASAGSVSAAVFQDMNVRYMALQGLVTQMQSQTPAALTEELKRVKHELEQVAPELERRQGVIDALTKKLDDCRELNRTRIDRDEFPDEVDVDSDVDEQDWPIEVKLEKMKSLVGSYHDQIRYAQKRHAEERGELQLQVAGLKDRILDLKERLKSANARVKKLESQSPLRPLTAAPLAAAAAAAASPSRTPKGAGLSLSMDDAPDAVEPEVERGTRPVN